jgi:hypothetical protein
MRRCGDCQLCCKLLPVADLGKPAGQRCKFQRALKGCTVYHQPRKGFPPSCALWNCAWLGGGDDTANLSRPDRVHYVIDIMPDFVTLKPHDDSEPTVLPVIQVWVDPAFPEAHRDPGLRAYIQARGEKEGCAALIRSSASDAFLLAPPSVSSDRQWHEKRTDRVVEETHTIEDVARHVGGLKMEIGVR